MLDKMQNRSCDDCDTDFARMLKDTGGIPAHGNSAGSWSEGHRFDAPNPEHRAGGRG